MHAKRSEPDWQGYFEASLYSIHVRYSLTSLSITHFVRVGEIMYSWWHDGVDTYGAVVRSSFLLRIGSDMMNGPMRWDSTFKQEDEETGVR